MKIISIFLLFFSVGAFSEQTFFGKVDRIEVVNYESGAAYVYIENANFTECPKKTNWCAIDFSTKASDQMYSAVLAAKLGGHKVGVTSNACWSKGQYPRCWKVRLKD
ncbi:hypothetical protein ACVBE9_03545 [Eionea flava]